MCFVRVYDLLETSWGHKLRKLEVARLASNLKKMKMKKLCLGGLDLFWLSPNISFEFHLRFLLIDLKFSALLKCWSDSINRILINCQAQLCFYPDQLQTTLKRAKVSSRYQIQSLNSESHSIVKPKVQIQSLKLHLNPNINLNNCEFQSCSICSFPVYFA